MLSLWLCADKQGKEWEKQRAWAFSNATKDFWGTVSSEPGTGGDLSKTTCVANRSTNNLEMDYELFGAKHFGSGFGISKFMVTTAIPNRENSPDLFVVSPIGSNRCKVTSEWNAIGMKATQSHGVEFIGEPAKRVVYRGGMRKLVTATGGFFACCYSAAIVGIVDIALETAREKANLNSGFAASRWPMIEMEYWKICAYLDSMIQCIEQAENSRDHCVKGKMAIAELAEEILLQLCRVVGGWSLMHNSPYGHWLQDVRALGFLRPPWPLSHKILEM